MRRRLMHLLMGLVVMLLLLPNVSYSALPGDFNNDGTVSISEVQACINSFLGINTASPLPGDFDNNGTVSIAEVQTCINSFLGIVPANTGSVSVGW